MFAATAPAASAVTRDAARTKALNATKTERTRAGVILFGLSAPLQTRTSIREAGRRPPPSGTSTRVMRSIFTLRGERAYFFYLDRGAYQSYEHPGRVVLVGQRSGRVLRSRTLRFAPVINGRLPIFLRSREAYELPGYRVFTKPYSVAGAARAAGARLGAFGGDAGATLRSATSEAFVAARLAAERSCSIVVGGRRSESAGSIGSNTGAPIAPLLVYDPAGGASLSSLVATQAIGRLGCRDIAIAVTGDGYRSLSPTTVRTSLATAGSRMREHHLAVATLRAVIAANPSVTFKLMIDAPGSGAFIEALRSLANVLVIATSSTASQTAFRYLPNKLIDGALRRNPLRMRSDSSFFTTMLFGGAAFSASDAEAAHAAAEVAAGRAPSFLAYMIARAFQLSQPFDFTADLGATRRLYTTFTVTPPGPLNGAPVASSQSVGTAEDTAKPIVLGASDPDSDALTYTVGAPAHGTLSGTAPNLVYTPAANYNGPDSFTFSVSDGSLVSATATVSITVTAVDDPPVTAASGTLAYTENDPPTPIAPAVTVTDVDSASLTGAMVKITANHVASDDLLALAAQPGITAAFDAPSGTLTLSGTASVAAYEAALRAVAYKNSSDNPGSAPRTVTFTSRDAGGFGPSALRTISITPVNDPPALTATATPTGFEEGDPPTPVDAGIDLTDPDSQISGATVAITANFATTEDVLAMPAQPNITASYNAGTGVLTLGGTDTPAAYEAALRAVTYVNTGSNPSTATRTVSFQVTDTAAAASNVATRDITIGPVNDAPVVTTSGGATAYTENAAAVKVDGAITVSDVDDANLESLTVKIASGYQPGDALTVTPGPLTGSYSAGILTLSGTASVATYQTVLRSIGFSSTNDAPLTSKTFWFTVNDGGLDSNTATKEIVVTPVDDPPAAVNDAKTVAEDSGASAVDVLANDTDVDAGPKSVVNVTQPTNGTVVITGGGTGLTYAPNANYCNSPPGTTPDTFTYTLAPGASTATVSMTVTCADDPPAAVNDFPTVGEDSGASAIDVLSNDTDIDGGPISVASVTQPANGTVVDNAASVSYTPNVNYCNTQAGGAPDTFTYTLTPGDSTATVSVTVTCANDLPIAVNDSATVSEDSAASSIDVLANDTDIDGGSKSVAAVTQPANGTVVNNTTSVSYTPNANYCNTQAGGTPDTFAYTLTPGGSTATVAMIVTCAADGPVVVAGGTLTYVENDPPTPIAPAVTVSDIDSDATITGATVAITTNYAAEDVLALSGIHPLITAMQAGATLTLTGTASVAEYQAALRDVTYVNSSDNPSTFARTVTFTVTDNAALTGSATRGIQVTAVDDTPVAVNDSATVNEDSGANAIAVLANDTDVDGGTKVVQFKTNGANGSVAITAAGTGVTYTPNANYCNNPPGGTPDTFTYTLNGGSIATVSVTVTCAADAPIVNTGGGSLSYIENDPATPIAPALTVTDPDPGAAITGATVAITANFAAGEDVLALANAVTHSPITAMFIGNTLTLSGIASPAAYQAALRDVTYRNTSEGPSTLPRTVAFTVTDDTALSGSDTRGITVAGVNDPPTAVNDTGTTDEDTTLLVSAPGVLANDTDVDPVDTKTVVALNGSGTLAQALPSGASVNFNANGSYAYSPLSAFQGLSTGQSATDSFTYTMQDGAGAQSTATVTITITGISDAPTAVADSFDAIGNTGLFVGTTRPANQAGKEITGSVLTNDTDPDTPNASLVAEPVTNAPTTLGGTITIESDGNFTYQPDDVDTGVTDTFTYRVCDASPCNAGTVANATGTLSLPIAGQVWYVRNNQAAGGDGTSDTPFDTLLEAETASGAGDTVFVFDGANSSVNLATGYVMAPNERLIGESQPLSLDPDGAGGPLPTSSLHPGTSGAQPTLSANDEDVVVLANDVVVDGVDIDPGGNGGGLSGGVGTSNVTVAHVNVIDTAPAGNEPGIDMDGSSGTNRFSDTTVQNGGSAGAIGVRLNNAGTVQFALAGTTTITTTGAKALDISNTNMGASQFDDVTVAGSGSGGVRVNATTGGSLVLGDNAGTDLTLQTTSGTTPALDITSSAGVTTGAGTNTISATGGPAVNVVNSPSAGGLQFASVSSTNSAGDGINLDSNSGASFSAAGGTISGAAGIAVDVNGGGAPGGVSYAGAINDGSGQSVEVTNRTGGGVTLAGNIADSADAGGGIVVNGNSAGTTTFSGASKVLNTGASNAVSMSSNGAPTPSGNTVAFTNGGLDIDTTSGQGLSMSNGGRLEVTGAGNSIATGTGTALTLNAMAITANNLNFDSISSNGAVNGINLNSTGTTGGLKVIGPGAAGSGGTIQNTTSDSIVLTTTRFVDLRRMNVTNSLENGINGNTVTNLDMTAMNITGSGDDSNDVGVRLAELRGTSAWSAVSATGSELANVRIENTSGTLDDLAVSGASHFDSLGTAFGGNSVLVEMRGTAVMTKGSIDGATFANNRPARGITVQSQETGRIGDSSTNAFVVQNSTFTDNGLHASFEQANSADLTFKMLNNGTPAAPMTMVNTAIGTASAVNVFSSSTSSAGTIRGRITGNRIGNAAVAGSGSPVGNGIRTVIQGDTVATLLYDANVIRQTPQARGIDIQVLGPLDAAGSGPHDITVTNNDVIPSDTTGFPASAIYVGADSQGGGAVTVRADIRANTVPAGAAIDSLPTYLALDKVVAAAVCQLVDTPPASANATAQLTSTNTGSASAAAGCALIAGPISTPP